MRIFVRGREVSVRFDPVEVARREPKLARLRQRLSERADGDEQRVDAYLTERLGSAVARFADGYIVEQHGRIDRIVELRSRLGEVYDRVIAGETPGPEAARTASALFSDLAAELRQLRDPRAALAEHPGLELAGAPPPTAPSPEVARALASQLDHVSRLPAGRAAAVHRASSLDPSLVGRIVGAETSTELARRLGDLNRLLKQSGMDRATRRRVLDDLRELNRLAWNERIVEPGSPAGRLRVTQLLDEIEDPTRHAPDPFTLDSGVDPATVPALSSMEQAVEIRVGDLGKRAQAARNRNSTRYAADLVREARRFRDWVAAQGGAAAVARALRAAIEADPDLQARLLRDGGISFLQRMWLDYNSEPRKSSFGDYVRNRTGQFRGQLGETAVGFTRGERFTFLKAPDDMVTQRGTDLVAVDRSTNEVLIIDNKAFSTSRVESVSALVRNFVRNIRDDVDAFRKDYAGATDLPPELTDAVARLERAADAIENDPIVQRARVPDSGNASTPTFDPNRVAQNDIQVRIDEILVKNGIRRVVTGEGGVVTAVSDDLRNIGINVSR